MEFLDSKNPNLEGEEVKSMPSRKDRWREGRRRGRAMVVEREREAKEKVQKNTGSDFAEPNSAYCVCVCVSHHLVVVGVYLVRSREKKY